MHSQRAALGLAGSVSVAWLVIAASACRADVPTVAEECRLRNAALCDLHGLQYIVDGPCPPEARTIRRPGQQRCDEAGQAGGTTVQAQPPVSIEVPPLPPPRRDLAWVGRIERWLLPGVLVIGGGVLAALLLRILRGRRARPDVERAGPRVGWTVVQLLVAASLAVPLAYQVAGLAFQRVFASFDNHDTAAPWLLAVPVGLLVFVLVVGMAFALLALAIGYLFKGCTRQQGRATTRQARAQPPRSGVHDDAPDQP